MSLRKNKVVVGIDFGTTFSGIAWAKIGDVSTVAVLSRWRSQQVLTMKVGSTEFDTIMARK